MSLLRLKNVTKHFGGVQALADISFEVERGTVVGLIGPNGAGKTTTFNVVTGFVTPDSGQILLGDRLLNGLPPHDICHFGVSRTFQIVRPFGQMTVLQNVMVGAFARAGRYSEAAREAHAFLDLVGLSSKAALRATTLNVAERRRLELARALASKPHVLLLDEVMSGLNATEVASFLKLLKALTAQGQTILFIEHVMGAVLSISDRIIVLDHGVKIAEGTPNDILSNEAVIEAYLGRAHVA